MDRFKNFLYDKNDIVIALVIVALAAVVIAGRIEVIMSYPDQVASAAEQESQNGEDTAADSGESQAGTTGTYTPGTSQDDSGDTPATPIYPATESGSVYPANTGDNDSETGNDGATEGDNTENGSSDTPPVVTNITVTIPSGTNGDGIAQILVSSGLISQKSDFTNAVTAAGADRKLKAGTFIVPSNATPSQIVTILTQ